MTTDKQLDYEKYKKSLKPFISHVKTPDSKSRIQFSPGTNNSTYLTITARLLYGNCNDDRTPYDGIIQERFKTYLSNHKDEILQAMVEAAEQELIELEKEAIQEAIENIKNCGKD